MNINVDTKTQRHSEWMKALDQQYNGLLSLVWKDFKDQTS